MPNMTRIEPKKNLIELQDEYSAAVLAARHKWAHRPNGGHAHRTRRAAFRRLAAGLKRWEFSDAQIRQAAKDADDMAHLLWLCGE